MLTLSIQQPWAWLIVNGYKDVENRGWPTNVRGKIQVHAGKKLDMDGLRWVSRTFPNIPLPDALHFKTGGIVGTVDIVDCVSSMDSPWFFGKFGFVLANGNLCDFVPFKGRLGFFKVP